jgi:predicted phage gp36 major capsid-like protein
MPDIQQLVSILKKSSRLSFSIPFFRYEMDLGQALDPKTVDERIARLDQIRADLIGAIDAVTELQKEAQDNKKEAKQLREAVDRLEQDKVTAETMLKVPEDSFARMLGRANSKARVRGLVEGSLIGFTTGALSSWLVWYLTK